MTADSDQNAVDNAWRIHAAIADWTKGVDSKASFVLTIESAVLAGVIALMGGHRRLAGVEGVFPNLLLYSGISLLAGAIVLVAWVVRPRTRNKNAKAESPHNFIYFGHLRFRQPADVERALQEEDILPMLSRQLVVMGQIAWVKHNQLKWSLNAALLGTALVGAAAAVT